jgi:hypothetical protein
MVLIRLSLGFRNDYNSFRLSFLYTPPPILKQSPLGYLPFTLAYDFHMKLLENTIFVQTYTWGQLFFPENIGAQKAFAVVWTLALVGALVWAITAGARNLKTRPAHLLNQSTEDLEVELKGLPSAGAAD